KLMDSLKDKFMDGAAEQNVTPAAAKQLWEDVEKAADYSFPKAHAACYALIAYQTAWLRANHPCEYMAAVISSVMNTKDRVPIYVNACHEMRIELVPAEVNESDGRLPLGGPPDHPAPRDRVAGRRRRRRREEPLRPQRRQGRGRGRGALADQRAQG